MTLIRKLGRTGRSASAVGLGCWAIGGPFTLDGRNDGWGDVDDAQSIRAIHLALDLGATLFDTADAYGTGHSEEVLGAALDGRRQDVVIATKFGFTYEADRRALVGMDVSPDYIAWAVEQSLRRLRVDCIDLYQIHPGDLTPEAALAAAEALETLAEAGKIAAWGWSTDAADAVRPMLEFPHFAAVQQELNVFHDGPDMLALCAEAGLASLNRSPLAMGLLSGKFTSATRFDANDVRGAGHGWVRHFEDGRPRPEVLGAPRAGARPPHHRRPHARPGGAGLDPRPLAAHLPGARLQDRGAGRRQSRALEKGPLPAAIMAEIDAVLRSGEAPA